MDTAETVADVRARLRQPGKKGGSVPKGLDDGVDEAVLSAVVEEPLVSDARKGEVGGGRQGERPWDRAWAVAAHHREKTGPQRAERGVVAPAGFQPGLEQAGWGGELG